jgi:hypothetical protein
MWNDELNESQKLRVSLDITLCRWVKNDWHFEGYTVRPNIGNFLPKHHHVKKKFISYLTESNTFLHSKYKITSADQQNKCSGIWSPHSFTPQSIYLNPQNNHCFF